MGPPGAPFRLGPGAKCPSCPPPLWAALIVCISPLNAIMTEQQAKFTAAGIRAEYVTW